MRTTSKMPTMADVCRSLNKPAAQCGTCGARAVCGGMTGEYLIRDPVERARRKCVMQIIDIRRDGRALYRCKVCGKEKRDTLAFHNEIMFCENGCMI